MIQTALGDVRTDAGLGSLSGDVPDWCLGLKIQLGPVGSSEFRPSDSGQQNQLDRDTRAPCALGDLIDVGKEGDELLVIKGALARPFGASRAKEQLNRRGFDNLPVDSIAEHL